MNGQLPSREQGEERGRRTDDDDAGRGEEREKQRRDQHAQLYKRPSASTHSKMAIPTAILDHQKEAGCSRSASTLPSSLRVFPPVPPASFPPRLHQTHMIFIFVSFHHLKFPFRSTSKISPRSFLRRPREIETYIAFLTLLAPRLNPCAETARLSLRCKTGTEVSALVSSLEQDRRRSPRRLS